MTALEALVLLIDSIDAHAASSGGGWSSRADRYVKLDWIADELADARRVIAEERCESVGR